MAKASDRRLTRPPGVQVAMVVELAVQHLVAGEAPRLRLAGARVALEHLVAQGLQHLFVDLLPLEVLFQKWPGHGKTKLAFAT